MRAYISYRYGVDLSNLYKLLKKNNIHFFDSLSDSNFSVTLQDTILTEIQNCDIFIIVYSEDSGNSGFEVGLAFALKKPIFAIISEQYNYPDFLIGAAHVNAKIGEIEKINYSFGLFLKNVKPRRKNLTLTKEKSKLSDQKISSTWLRQYRDIEFKNEYALEYLFEHIFKDSNIQYVSQPKEPNSRYTADFAIWSDQLTPYLGNPILIEIKRELSRRNLDSLLSELLEGTQRSNANSSIVFYEKSSPEFEFEIKSKCNPTLLIIKIEDFINSISTIGFDKSIINFRNKIVHNV